MFTHKNMRLRLSIRYTKEKTQQSKFAWAQHVHCANHGGCLHMCKNGNISPSIFTTLLRPCGGH